MSDLRVDQRDEQFVLNEMLDVEALLKTSLFGHLSRMALPVNSF
jgi:hypothetical protein